MSIIKSLFRSTLLLLILAGVAFLISREVLLWWATGTVKNSLLQLKEAYTRSAYADQCLTRGSVSIVGEDLVTLQLRFISSNEYVLEAVCGQFMLSPIVIETVSLPPFVTKSSGSSGMVWKELSRTGIKLVVFGQELEELSGLVGRDMSWLSRTRMLAVDDRRVVQITESTELQPGPVTSCSGYGFGCCNPITQVGAGDQISGALECEASCFNTCLARPVILAFTSSPFFDLQTRTLTVSTGEVAEFSYFADHESDSAIKAVIEFGDGDIVELVGAQNTTSHTYTCPQAQCTYPVKLTLRDERGTLSADTTLSNLVVVVNR